MNEIVVGVDRSDTARRAALTGAQLATALGRPLHLVMAVSRDRSIDVKVRGGDGSHTDWVSAAEQFLDALRGELRTPEATCTVSLSEPAAAMCEEAERLNASMIVVGNRRVQGLSRVLGAVATDVVRHAPCDVLVANTAD
jgi:nucleotide-binding universal stress UspA family protein